MRFNPNSGHMEKTEEDYAEEKRRWAESTSRVTARLRARTECVCWDYETPNAPCTCGAAS
jgi:hypothetical protein